MQTPIPSQLVQETIENLRIKEIGTATIRQMVAVAQSLEEKTGQKFIHLEMGSPGLPACQVGVEAEKKALDNGVASVYPNIAGIPELKKAASRFVKAFLDVDIAPDGCIPTVGSMMGSLSSFIAVANFSLFFIHSYNVLTLMPNFSVAKSCIVQSRAQQLMRKSLSSVSQSSNLLRGFLISLDIFSLLLSYNAKKAYCYTLITLFLWRYVLYLFLPFLIGNLGTCPTQNNK